MKISIPKACHEDWNKMTPQEQGRFCAVCSKTVIDFTAMNKDQIKDYFIAKKEEKTCGIFLNSQLDTAPLPKIVPLFDERLKKFAIAIYIVFGLTLFSCSSTENPTVGEIEHVEGISIDTAQVTNDTIPEINKGKLNTYIPDFNNHDITLITGQIEVSNLPPFSNGIYEHAFMGDTVYVEEIKTKGGVKALPNDTLKSCNKDTLIHTRKGDVMIKDDKLPEASPKQIKMGKIKINK